MTFAEYRALPGINASLLKKFREGESLFQALHEMHCPPDNDAMRFGRTLHQAIQHHGQVGSDVVELPFDDLRTKDARIWKAGREAAGKPC